jgi:hypothetical protein
LCTVQLFLGWLSDWAVHRVARDAEWEHAGFGCAGVKRFCCRQILGLDGGAVVTVAG